MARTGRTRVRILDVARCSLSPSKVVAATPARRSRSILRES